MFSNSDVNAAGFTSNWKNSRTSEDNYSQTTVIAGDDKEIQSIASHPVGVQTVAGGEELLATEYDEERLAKFLGRICPDVLKELDRASHSKVLASYFLTSDSLEAVEEILRLPSPGSSGVKVSGLSWSCTGSVLAVAFSHTLHSSWCSHQAHIALYNVDRDNKNASQILEAPSCLRSVTMHPHLSSVVAAGTFSGEVLVWDLSRPSSELALVNASHTRHNDSVTEVRWVPSATSGVILVSSALDGHIIFWKVSTKLSSYQILDRYSCALTRVEPGIRSFAFPHHKEDPFVVAMEGGALLHCSATAAKPVVSVSCESIKDPVISSFETQPVTITCVEFSPHQEDVFATVATDQAIRIYRLFQRCAQHVLWAGGIVGVDWSPVQPHTLIGWGNSSIVSVYNSLSGEALATFSPDGTDSKAHLCIASFNAKSPCLLAVGNLEGVAYVWKIPSQLPSEPKNM